MATEHEVRRTDGSIERTTRSGGNMGAIVALIIGLALVLVIGWFLMNMNRNDAVESNAIAGAAESVGNAAENVGDAAGSAAPSSDR